MVIHLIIWQRFLRREKSACLIPFSKISCVPPCLANKKCVFTYSSTVRYTFIHILVVYNGNENLVCFLLLFFLLKGDKENRLSCVCVIPDDNASLRRDEATGKFDKRRETSLAVRREIFPKGTREFHERVEEFSDSRDKFSEGVGGNSRRSEGIL